MGVWPVEPVTGGRKAPGEGWVPAALLAVLAVVAPGEVEAVCP